MALLETIKGDQRHALSARVLVGRGRRCDLKLPTRHSSAEHAVLFWNDTEWHVRDLGSRNGTQIDGLALETPTQRIPEGARITFGDPEAGWILRSAGPPEAVLWRADAIEHTDAGLLTDDPEQPTLSIFSAADGRWLIEQDGVPRFLTDGETLSDGGRVYLPIGGANTEAATIGQSRTASAQAMLAFQVSQDEEFVEIAFEQGGQRTVLSPRAFHYLLLILARERQRDIDAGTSSAEQGWVHIEDLCRMAETEPSRINVDVYRARRQLAKAGLVDAGQVVERRSTSRQVRFGFERFEVRSL